ncbi:hypothetical protein [Actinomadura vinacea]|uniref:hypothetical protein n=1 Tax=Actinomadura vinacea TaxID=115336 RepID=UPI0031D4028E
MTILIGSEALLPIAIVGFFGFVFPLALHCQRLLWTWRCRRILHRDRLDFRGPIERIQRTGQGVLVSMSNDPPRVSPLFGKRVCPLRLLHDHDISRTERGHRRAMPGRVVTKVAGSA